jgi:hypothetical protein
MVLHGKLCGRVGRRRILFERPNGLEPLGRFFMRFTITTHLLRTPSSAILTYVGIYAAVASSVEPRIWTILVNLKGKRYAGWAFSLVQGSEFRVQRERQAPLARSHAAGVIAKDRKGRKERINLQG